MNTPYKVGELQMEQRLFISKLLFLPFQLRVLQDEVCEVMCDVILDADESNALMDRIREDYTIHM